MLLLTPVRVLAPAAPPPSRCSCNRLRRAARALTQLYDEVMAPSALRITQFALLRAVARAGSAKITELAHWLALDRTALRRNLQLLEQRNLVRVTRGRDARVREVTLTLAGREAIAAATPFWERGQRTVARGLGERKLATLLSALDEVEALASGAKAARGSPLVRARLTRIGAGAPIAERRGPGR